MKLLILALLFIVTVFSRVPAISALRFGIIGDWGMGGRKTPWDTEIRSAAAYNEACETFFAEGFCNLTLSVGDNIYTPDVGMGLKESFGLFSKNTGPFFLVTGNHDNMGPQLAYAKQNKRWKWPERFHDFKVPIDDSGRDGHTVHFFGLDSQDGSLHEGGGQYKWLEEKLKTCNSRWKIFFAHFPVTGAGRHRREGSVTSLTKLMDKYNVQVFFSGHDHILDVNVMQGKVMPISGAMARGGMMLRGIAGGAHHFTLTQPGEFNENKVDWPGHGFFTAELSANILTVHSWDHFGGIMYSFQTTFDWIAKVHKMPSAMENKFPPQSEVKAAALAEKELARGPGGGKFYTLDGDEIDAPKYFETGNNNNNNNNNNKSTAEGETKARLTEKPVDTSFTKFSDEVPITIPTRINNPDFITTLAAEERAKNTERDTVAKYVRYTASSECMNCERDIYANESFSIFVVGMDLTSKSRIFLSESKIGCTMSKYFPKRVEGTSIIQPNGNQAVFSAAKATNPTYACLSLDAGKNYVLLKRIDDLVNVDGFIIKRARTDSEKKPSSANINNNKNNNNPVPPPPSPGTESPSTQQDGDTTTNQMDGSSIGQYLVIVGVALLVGVAISALSKSQFFEELNHPHASSSESNEEGNNTNGGVIRGRERLSATNDEGENNGNVRDTGAVDE